MANPEIDPDMFRNSTIKMFAEDLLVTKERWSLARQELPTYAFRWDYFLEISPCSQQSNQILVHVQNRNRFKSFQAGFFM